MMQRFQPGSFVWTFDQFGIGQVDSHENGQCRVRFFGSISDEGEAVYAKTDLQPAYLSPQTRAYHQDEDGIWSVGRIIDFGWDNGKLVYDIRFPNGRELRINEEDLRVRCLQPVNDPAAILAAGGMESQFLHDRRRAAIECLTTGRSASFGLTALLSASVELAPHQVDVVRRILSDSVQRYLLADEVGLGKTIEACTIVSQALRDNPEERAVIVVPSTLAGQWKRELSWRFFLEPSPDRLRVVSYEEINSIDPRQVDTFVVDEAQNLIPDNPQASESYRTLKDIAHRAHRLLLISATPVLGNEKTFLALLHLLDPFTYRLEDEGGFVRKLKKRQEFGRLLLTIRPDQNPVLLRLSLRQLRELVPEDEFAGSLLERIEQSLNDKDGDSIFSSVTELHRHISDTYRLHQRLIRTRRRDLSSQQSLYRVAEAPVLSEDEDERSALMMDALDRWRILSLNALATKQDELATDFEWKMADRYRRLHEALGTSVEACGEELESQLTQVELGQIATFQEDEEALAYASSILDEPYMVTRVGSAVAVIVQALGRIANIARFPRLVVFESTKGFVECVAAQLRKEGISGVFCVTEDSNEDDALGAVDGFFTYRGPSVLCCDRSGEEGLNLQYAHGIVQLDLPLAPTRIEQRIGRLDRFGRELLGDRTIHHWVVTPYADHFHPWEAWYKLLRDDFGVFEQSISEVQFLLDDLQEEVVRALYRNGSEGIRSLGPQVRDTIKQERQRLDEQYALDSRSLISSDEADAFQHMASRDTSNHYHPLHSWLTEVLFFGDEWLEDYPVGGAFRLHWTSRTLVPRQPWQELFPDRYLATPMTYDRRTAAGRRGLRVVRPGLELIDNLERMLRWDDRGTAYATWRMEPSWPGGNRAPWLGFRLVFVVEANRESAHETLKSATQYSSFQISFGGVKRRLDTLLPPWTADLFFDIEMEPVTDSRLLEILARPYSDQPSASEGRDYNLGSRRNALYKAIGFEELYSACTTVRQMAEVSLRASREFTTLVNDKVQSALMELEVERRGLERRGEAVMGENGLTDRGLEVELMVNSAVSAGIASPSIRVDSIGLIVVANTPPEDHDQSQAPQRHRQQ